jgi:hypothetical protein
MAALPVSDRVCRRRPAAVLVFTARNEIERNRAARELSGHMPAGDA